MRKINTKDIEEYSWSSPKGTFKGAGKGLSEALGRNPLSSDSNERHPFDVEICRIPAGQKPYPYHSHSAQWEFYHVISGTGSVRHKNGTTAIEAGDTFIFRPDEPHQLFADSPHYPDSNKWLVRSPERRLMRSESLDYFDGEE